MWKVLKLSYLKEMKNFFFNSIKLKGYFVIERERDAVHAHVIAFFFPNDVIYNNVKQ